MWLQLSLFLLVSAIKAQTNDDSCFRLNKNNENMVVFDDPGDISTRFRYKLSFNTREAFELLYYVEGDQQDESRDYEGLFIEDGILIFFSFNPAPYGAGRSYGSHVQTNFTVNTGKWVEVEFFRNIPRVVDVHGSEENQIATGMIVDGKEFIILGLRPSLDFNGLIWLGGHPDMPRITRFLKTFDGEIRNFFDLERNIKFDNPHENSDFEEATCIDIPPPA